MGEKEEDFDDDDDDDYGWKGLVKSSCVIAQTEWNPGVSGRLPLSKKGKRRLGALGFQIVFAEPMVFEKYRYKL